jgi:hypothetical protein
VLDAQSGTVQLAGYHVCLQLGSTLLSCSCARPLLLLLLLLLLRTLSSSASPTKSLKRRRTDTSGCDHPGRLLRVVTRYSMCEAASAQQQGGHTQAHHERARYGTQTWCICSAHGKTVQCGTCTRLVQ